MSFCSTPLREMLSCSGVVMFQKFLPKVVLPHEFVLSERVASVAARTTAHLWGCRSASLLLNVDSLPTVDDQEEALQTLRKWQQVDRLEELSLGLHAALEVTCDSLRISPPWARERNLKAVAALFCDNQSLRKAAKCTHSELVSLLEGHSRVGNIQGHLFQAATALEFALNEWILGRCFSSSDFRRKQIEDLLGIAVDCILESGSLGDFISDEECGAV
jgi:hypothetical protein